VLTLLTGVPELEVTLSALEYLKLEIFIFEETLKALPRSRFFWVLSWSFLAV
jgi:hypothetical protein